MGLKRQKKIKREYIPIIITGILLVIFIIALIYIIFFVDDKEFVLPDLPKEDSIKIGSYEFENGKNDANDLTKEKETSANVDFKVITDYYKNGITLTNLSIDYKDEKFIITSGKYASVPFVSVVSKEGKLEWLAKIDMSGYDSYKVVKTIKKDKDYYVFTTGAKEDSVDNFVIKYDSKGKEEQKENIDTKTKNALSVVTEIENGFALLTDGKENIKIYLLSYELKTLKTSYSLNNDKANLFHTLKPTIKNALYENKTITAVLQYAGEHPMYLLYYNTDTNTSRITSFTELEKISKPFNNPVHIGNNNLFVHDDNKVYKLNTSNKLLSTYDYSSSKLKPIEGKDEDGQTIDNMLVINDIHVYDSYVFVKSTTYDEDILDVFDQDLKLKKRYVLNQETYSTQDSILLKAYYIDGKLYEINSFGVDTPSIMISVIG